MTLLVALRPRALEEQLRCRVFDVLYCHACSCQHQSETQLSVPLCSHTPDARPCKQGTPFVPQLSTTKQTLFPEGHFCLQYTAQNKKSALVFFFYLPVCGSSRRLHQTGTHKTIVTVLKSSLLKQSKSFFFLFNIQQMSICHMQIAGQKNSLKPF